MARLQKIIDLRNLLAERFPQPGAKSSTHFVTGFDLLDQTIGGGLPKNALTELISPHFSAGSASVIHRLTQAAQTRRYFIALIDGCDSFDPQSLPNESLRHLLWVRCQQTIEAVKATDLLLRDGNFPLVILDLVLNAFEQLRKIPQTTWYRLQRLAENTSVSGLILTRQNLVTSAAFKIVLENRWALSSNENPELQFQIRRSHFNSAITTPQSATL